MTLSPRTVPNLERGLSPTMAGGFMVVRSHAPFGSAYVSFVERIWLARNIQDGLRR